jgi:hypothetical protein
MTTFWEQMPPPRQPVRQRARWSWPVAVVAFVSATALLAVVIISGIGLVMYANHDRIELIDRPDVVAAVDAGCGRLRAGLAASPVDVGSPALVRAAAITAQDEAIRAFVAEIRRLDPADRADDLPVDGWLADWVSLAVARDEVADSLRRGGRASLVVPRDGGEAITRRMATVGVSCVDLSRLVRRT